MKNIEDYKLPTEEEIQAYFNNPRYVIPVNPRYEMFKTNTNSDKPREVIDTETNRTIVLDPITMMMSPSGEKTIHNTTFLSVLFLIRCVEATVLDEDVEVGGFIAILEDGAAEGVPSHLRHKIKFMKIAPSK